MKQILFLLLLAVEVLDHDGGWMTHLMLGLPYCPDLHQTCCRFTQACHEAHAHTLTYMQIIAQLLHNLHNPIHSASLLLW
jgi:hypothetical protein